MNNKKNKTNINKIFFIGFNKTGTCTYDRIVGQKFSHTHVGYWCAKSKTLPTNELLIYFKKYTCYSDGELCDFKRLDKLFPDSKFILNDRNIKNWLYSRICFIHQRPIKGFMAREYLNAENKQDIIRLWIERRLDYYRDVGNYFNLDSEKFMVIDIEKDDIIDKLSNFLKTEFFSIKKVNEGRVDKNILKNELCLVDEVLKQYSKDNEYFNRNTL